MPEDKYKVVQALRANGHLVGMTGDGVNDAPALKAADVGIAVADATDAARSASDMVLLTEGLSVIIKAILGSRCIFQRMRNYATYACATTIRIVTTFSLMACIWKFTYPPFLVLIIAVLNDGTIMTVSTDRVQPSLLPDSWRLKDIFVMAFVLGFYLTLSSLIFFYLIVDTDFFERTFGATPLKYNVTNPVDNESFMLCGVIYLQVSITGQLIIFTTRARTFFFLNRPSILLMCAAVVAQLTATLIAVYGNSEWTQLYPIGWGWAAITWVWSLIWIIPMDIPKIICNSTLDGTIFQFTTGIDRMFQRRFNQKGFGAAQKEGRSRSASGPNSSQRQRRTSIGAKQ
jgi:H+-transporting ATPase